MLPQLQRYLRENWLELRLGPTRPRELTLSVQATGVGKICCFLFPDDATEPCLVAKIRRSPGENDLLASEYDLIEYLRRNGSDFVRATVPGALARFELAGRLVALEPFLRGRMLDGLMAQASGTSRKPLADYFDVAIGWLLRCQRETPQQRGRLDEAQLDRYFLGPIAQLRSTARLTAAESRYLDRLVDSVGLTAARFPLPLVFRHGDFQPGNILLREGSLQVIDWELGERLTLPLLDLYGFLLRTHARRLALEEIDGFLEDHLLNFRSVLLAEGEFAGYTAEYVGRGLAALDIAPAWAPLLLGMFLVVEANKYASLLRQRAANGYLYLLRSRSAAVGGTFADQLARQKNVWLLGELANNESDLAFIHTGSRSAMAEPGQAGSVTLAAWAAKTAQTRKA